MNPGDGLRYLMFSYPRRIAASGVTYTVQVSTDLVSWQTPVGEITEVGTVPTGDGVTETVSVRIGPAISPSNPVHFVNVRVTTP